MSLRTPADDHWEKIKAELTSPEYLALVARCTEAWELEAIEGGRRLLSALMDRPSDQVELWKRRAIEGVAEIESLTRDLDNLAETSERYKATLQAIASGDVTGLAAGDMYGWCRRVAREVLDMSREAS